MSRHAYLIMAHDDLPVLTSLLRLIDDPRNTIFIHLDARFSAAQPEQLQQACTRSLVVFVPRRRVYWGDYSQIDASLRLFRAAVPGRFDYYHLISGADLPLKPQDDIHAFFNRHAGREFIGYATDFDPAWASELHFFNRYMRPANRLQRAIRNRGTQNIVRMQRRIGYDHTRWFGVEVRKGSDWFSITHAMATHLLGNTKLVSRMLRFGHAPSELYMQTLAWNSEFRDRLFDPTDEFASSARLIDWERGGPYVFTQADLPELLASDRMFARKFMSTIDPHVINRMVEHLTAKSSDS